MTIGLASNTTKGSVDADIGQAALALRKAFAQIEELRHYCLITPDATLVALGYTQAEVAIIKSAFADGDTLFQVATGAASLPTPTNLLANLDQLAGDLLVTR